MNKIKASQAYTDRSSLYTVINNKRNIAFIIPKFVYKDPDKVFDKLRENKIKWLKTTNPYNGIIIYRKIAEYDAKKLQKLIKKGNGFLIKKYWKKIGDLLQYKITN